MASFTQPGDDSVPTTGSTLPFDDDGYLGYDPRLSSQRFDPFIDSESLKDSATDSPIMIGTAQYFISMSSSSNVDFLLYCLNLKFLLFLANQEKLHAEVDKNYRKAIADFIPNEVPAIEKKRGKKDTEKKPSILVVQGPKPRKPTELSRMRQILLKLKHNTPPRLKPSPPLLLPTRLQLWRLPPSRPGILDPTR
ncbi:hypothetical protein FF1_041430 [Malus domestica]